MGLTATTRPVLHDTVHSDPGFRIPHLAFHIGLVALLCLLSLPVVAQTSNVPGGNDWLNGDIGLPSIAASAKDPAGRISIEAVSSHLKVTPGQTFDVALKVALKDGWSWYSPKPGEGMPVLPGSVDADAGNLKAGPVLWPPHTPHETLGETHNAYMGTITIFVPVTVPKDATMGERQVTISPRGQICGENQCVQIPKLVATAMVTVADKDQTNPAWTLQMSQALAQAKPAEQLSVAGKTMGKYTGGGLTEYGTIGGLALALLAGLILNIMPCVLPVIPLKVLSIAQQAKESRHRFITLGMCFAGGIVLFFVALALFNAILKVVLQDAFQWGEHFQIPAFRIGMAMLMVALAVNMFGGFTVLAPRHAHAAHGRLETGEGHATALGMGVLTAVLSTPCSFAILTAAFAWAQGQPLWLGSLGIVMIGVGMALPYAVLTCMPHLVQRLPKPGMWMEHFKQSMGFVLLIVAVWLTSTFSADAYPFWILAYAIVLAFCLWMWGSWVRYDAPLYKKTTIRTVAAIVAICAGFFMLMPPAPHPQGTQFVEFNENEINQTLSLGRPVLIDFTANWCINCKAVEKLVYNDAEVAKRLKDQGILAVRGDTTTKDLPANAALRHFGDAIPVTVILPPNGGEPIRLRGIFSKQDLFNALDKAMQH